jgi:6-pyruvoyltetrahydropterin/6-carboxytetrahydropterin synthase
MACEISKFVELDAAHRVPYHQSKCKNLHGHRYKVEMTVTGQIRDDHTPEHGMVLDFSFMKELLMEFVHEPCDHAMILWVEDADFMN